MQALPSRSASGEQARSAPPPSFSSLLPLLRPLSEQGPSLRRSASASQREAAPGPTAPLPAQPLAEGVGLAHDAGNLLGAIRLYCDLLALPGVLRTEHRHYAEELRQLGARSGTLIERLLRNGGLIGGAATAQRAPRESGAQKVAPLRLGEVVTGCRGLLDMLAGEAMLLVSVEAHVASPVAAPREAVERILVNLVKNAVEAGAGLDAEAGTSAGTEERAAVIVRVRTVPPCSARPAGGVSLGVEDRGRGMSEAMVRALLAGDAEIPEAAARPGRGIGFAVVRELAGATGAELRVRSRLGRGTTVELVWPVAESG